MSLQPDLRWKRCDVKSVNLLGNVLANQAAKEAGAAEAILYLEDGTITEASHSSFFGVVDGVIRTTPLRPGILPSVTRKFTAAADRASWGCRSRCARCTATSWRRRANCSWRGTSMEVCPVVAVDARIGRRTASRGR